MIIINEGICFRFIIYLQHALDKFCTLNIYNTTTTVFFIKNVVMNKTINESTELKNTSLTEYRKSIFFSDNTYGAIVVLIGLVLVYITGISDRVFYFTCSAYMLLCLLIHFLLKMKNYRAAVYLNLLGSLLILSSVIFIFGNSYGFRFFFLSISLSAFIYSSNQQFNKSFFLLNILFFGLFSIFEINPVYQINENSADTVRKVCDFLIIISFAYKGMLIFNLYIKTEGAEKKKNLIYQTLFNNSYEGIVTIQQNKLGAVSSQTLNYEILNLFGINKHESKTFVLNNYFPKFQPDGANSKSYFNSRLNNLKTENTIEFDFSFERNNGTEFIAKVTIVKIDEILEDITIYMFKDITKQVEAQNIIAAQMNELNIKNKQLKGYIDNSLQFESFAHLAAHDLKTPTRTLISFSQLLEKHNKGKLDNDSIEYLGFIKGAAKKIKRLINDLSEYTKISTGSEVFGSLNVTLLIESVLKDIRKNHASNTFNIQLSNLPTNIIADTKKLKVLFKNLINNAIQFKKPDNVPNIEISCLENNAYYQFSVKDNGIGIEMEYLKGIFVLFKKLNSSDASNTTGVGLATCLKIAELHEGKIWVESIIGKGSVFYFNISKTLKQSS